jgi:hypothetical protein
MYLQTGNQGPYTYIGHTPGPRLYGSTIMAVDLNSGERIWWNQPMPRDPYDYDCNWSGILADVPGLGKVYMKGCKEGLLHILDADTGEPVHLIDVIEEQVSWGQITDAALTEPYEGQGGIRYHTMDPYSYYDMREMTQPDGSNYCPRPCPVYPYFMNGIFANDMAYDPDTGILYHYALALQCVINDSPDGSTGSFSVTVGYPVQNTTIVARDVATGEVKWTYFYPYSEVRSHMTVTKELVYAGFNDGTVKFFDKATGAVLKELVLGSELKVGLTTGQDSAGDQKIFAIIGVGSGFFAGIMPTLPGTIVAMGLADVAVGGTTTVTSTSTTTSSTTTTTTSTATTTVTSTSSTTSTVTATTTSATTATTTQTSTQTAAPSTTTVTSEVTEEVGLSAEVTYAAIAVAIIAIAAAAVLVLRKPK